RLSVGRCRQRGAAWGGVGRRGEHGEPKRSATRSPWHRVHGAFLRLPLATPEQGTGNQYGGDEGNRSFQAVSHRQATTLRCPDGRGSLRAQAGTVRLTPAVPSAWHAADSFCQTLTATSSDVWKLVARA